MSGKLVIGGGRFQNGVGACRPCAGELLGPADQVLDPSGVFGTERRPSTAPELSDTAAQSSLSFDTSIPRNSIR
jgi:hypothetical protein